MKKNYNLSIIIIGALFFVFGFITWLNATLIPYLKISCQLTTLESYFVTFAFYISYFVMAIPSSKILKLTGYKRGMSLGLAIMAIGALIFIPAAISRTYQLFLLGLFVQGTGLSLLQTASNPYVTILGPIESAAKRISIMGLANKLAGIISPIILGTIVLNGIDKIKEKIETIDNTNKIIELNKLSHKVITPYIIIAISLIILAIIIIYTNLPDIKNEDDTSNDKQTQKTNIFQFPYLILGVITLFLYVGVEVLAVDTLINYGKYLGFKFAEAKFFSSYTLFAMIIGYLFGIITIPKYISQENVLKYFAILGIIFSTVAILSSNAFTSILMIASLGFANSLMWPAIWPLAINNLGKFTKTGSALLIMAIAGGALLPLLYGYLSETTIFNNQTAYFIFIPSYLFILFYATKGYKIGQKSKNI